MTAALMPGASTQAASFRDLTVSGQGNSVVINQVMQISVEEIKTRLFVGGSPYVGLSRFEERHKDFFFGRDRLVAQLLERVSAHNLMLVTGASGSGKSSLVRSGLLPQLAARLPQGRFRPILMTPDRDPFVSLRSALQSAGISQRRTGEIRADSALSLAEVLRELRPAEDLWVLVVDQFEELFTLCADHAVRSRFAEGLAQVAAAAQAELKIVLALRADFFDRLGAYPELGRLAERGLCLVMDMDVGDLRAAIEQPAARHGVVFEAGLVERIIADVRGRPGALPLLQFTLDLLWREDNPADDRTLNLTTYQRIGGVEGALRRRADALFAASSGASREGRPKREQELFRRTLLRLVDFAADSESARPVGKRGLLSEFSSPEEVVLIAELVEEKLLVTNAALQAGSLEHASTVEVAHEALLSSWPQLCEWLTQGREVIYTRNRLHADTLHWLQVKNSLPGQAHADEELWTGTRLQQALDMQQRNDFQTVLGGLLPEEQTFLASSAALRDRRAGEEAARREVLTRMELERQRQRTRFLRLGVGLLSVSLFVTGAFAFYAWEKNKAAGAANTALAYARDAAEQRELDSYVEQGRELLLNKREPLTALLWLHKAYVGGSRHKALHHLLAHAVRPLDAVKKALIQSTVAANSVAFSPDGRAVLVARDDGTVQLYDVQSGQPRISFEGHDGIVWNASHSPDGRRIVTASDDKKARVFDTASGKYLFSLLHVAPVRCASYSPDGRRIVTASDDKQAQVFDAETGTPLLALRGHDHTVNSARYSPDGQRIVTTSDDKLARIFDANTGNLLGKLVGHSEAVVDASYSPDGRLIVTAAWDGTARIWDIAAQPSKEPKETFSLRSTLTAHHDPVMSASFSPSGRFIVTASRDKTAHIWDARSGDLLDSLHGQDSLLNHASYSRSGDHIATASERGSVWIWKAGQGSLIQSFAGWKGAELRSVSYSPDGARLVVSAANTFPKILDASSGQLLVQLTGTARPAYGASYSPDGRRVVSAGAGNTADVFDAQTGKPLLTLQGHTGAVRSASYSRDGRSILTASQDKTARIFDAETGKQRRVILSHSEPLTSASFDPDGRQILTVSASKKVQVFDAESGEQQLVLTGPSSEVGIAVFSPTGKRIATAGEAGKGRIWDAVTGRPIVSFGSHTGAVHSIAYSANGDFVVTAGEDNRALVWEAETGRLVESLGAQADAVTGVAFSPDGRRIVTASQDSRLHLYGFVPEQRSAADLALLMKCHLKIKLDGAFIAPNKPDPAACLELMQRNTDSGSAQRTPSLAGESGQAERAQ